jgi:hypothetical protein
LFTCRLLLRLIGHADLVANHILARECVWPLTRPTLTNGRDRVVTSLIDDLLKFLQLHRIFKSMAEKCQGLPSGPCPEAQCGKSLKYTVYDLFLCPSFERTRETLQIGQHKGNANDKTQAARRERSKNVGKKMDGNIVPEHDLLTDCAHNNGHVKLQTKLDCITDGNEDNSADEDEKCTSCPSCLLTIGDSVRNVTCHICENTYHQKCTTVTDGQVFDKFIGNVKSSGRICAECKIVARSCFQQLKSAIAHLAEDLADVKRQRSEMKDSNMATTCDPPAKTDVTPGVTDSVSPGSEEVNRRTTLIVQRTLTDTSRRKKNVIISGSPENALQGDRAELVRLYEERLSLKPLVAENGCKRIGKAQSGRPRKLLVQPYN